MRSRFFVVGGLVCGALSLAAASSVQGAVVFQATAADYNAATNTFVPDVGPAGAYNVDETVAGHEGLSVVPNATPNGSAALAFDGTSGVQFPAVVFAGAGGAETIFAVLVPSADFSSPQTIVSGGPGSLQYRIDDTSGPNAGEQGVLNRDNFQFGNSSVIVDPTTFSVVDVTLGPTTPTAVFTDDGVVVGDPGSTYGPGGLNAIARFGEAQVSADGTVNNEYFRGDIAELLIYNTSLDTADRQAVEAQLTAQFISPVPEPMSLGLLATGSIALLARRRRTV